MFFSLQNKTKLVPGKLGVRCGPGLLSASRARRSPSCRRGGGSRLAVGAPLLARRPRRPPLPRAPGAPRAPLPNARQERGPGWHLPTRPARYLSRHLSGADLRGAGGSGSPAASAAPPEPGGSPPCLWPPPRPPLSRAPRLARAPAGSGSLRDGIRCQRGGQAPPVGGAQPPALTWFPPPPPPAGALLRAPRRPSALGRGRPAGGSGGAAGARTGLGSRSRFNLAGSGREGCGWRSGAEPNLPGCAAPRAAAAARQTQRQSERGRGRVRRGLMEGAGSRRRRRCPSLPSSLPGSGRRTGRREA